MKLVFYFYNMRCVRLSLSWVLVSYCKWLFFFSPRSFQLEPRSPTVELALHSPNIIYMFSLKQGTDLFAQAFLLSEPHICFWAFTLWLVWLLSFTGCTSSDRHWGSVDFSEGLQVLVSPVEKLDNHTADSEVEPGYYEKVCFQERGGSAQRKFTGSNSNAVQSASAFMLQ